MSERKQNLDKLKAFHAKSKAFDGARIWMAFRFLRAAIRWGRQERGSIMSGFDYGCGKLTQYEKNDLEIFDQELEVIPDLQTGLGLVTVLPYDPGLPGYDKLPADSFDVAFAVDVYEYIPKEDIQLCLTELASRAKKMVFISATWKQPGKFHKTVPGEVWDRDESFWLSEFSKAASRYSDLLWVIRLSSGSGYPKVVPREEHLYHRKPGYDGWAPGIPGYVQEAHHESQDLDRLGQPLPGTGESPGADTDPPSDTAA